MAELNFKLTELTRISPSQYNALKRCPLKVVLANSINNPLLPYSPKNHLGNVIHTCIQLISQNKITNIEGFDKEWDRLIKIEEDKLRNADFDFYLPLKTNVQGYTIKKLQTKELIKRKLKQPSPNKSKFSTVVILTEKWLESKDQKIGGKVDLIYKSKGLTKLSDFKTGKIFEDEGEIKKDYEDQLKLYAYLYKENYKVYPDKISIIDLEKEEYFIDFTPQECEHLAKESKGFLFEINQLVAADNLDNLARPEKENCNNCLYRPACKFYWKCQDDSPDLSFVDINGTLTKIKQFNNGDINAYVNHDGKAIKIYHIKNILETFLSKKLDKKIAFFNLKKIGELKYKALKTTKIYDFHEG